MTTIAKLEKKNVKSAIEGFLMSLDNEEFILASEMRLEDAFLDFLIKSTNVTVATSIERMENFCRTLTYISDNLGEEIESFSSVLINEADVHDLLRNINLKCKQYN